jgi:hypothetical protein
MGFNERTYEFDPIYIQMGHDELLDVTVCRPPRHHGESIRFHNRPYKRQYVLMLEGLPSDNLPAEVSQNVGSFRR